MATETQGSDCTAAVETAGDQYRSRTLERQLSQLRRSVFALALGAVQGSDPSTWRRALEHIALTAAFGDAELSERAMCVVGGDR